METSRRGGVLERIMAVLLVLFGLGMGLPGIYLITLGGSPYYLIAGLLMLISAVGLWRHRGWGYGVGVLLIVGTLIWALWESGFEFWPLLPRLDVEVVFAILLAIAWWRRTSGAKGGVRAGGVAALLALLVAGGVAGALSFTHGGRAIAADIAATIAPNNVADGEWPNIGNNPEAERFSKLAQITPANVDKLQIAWKIHTGMPQGMGVEMESTPIKIGDSLYTCGTKNDVLAIDAETGAIRWHYDPNIDKTGVGVAACRGVTYVPAPAVSKDNCGARIVVLTHDARMIAVDAASGQLCSGFGVNGQVDLRQGMGPVKPAYLYYTSPAVLVHGKLIMGSCVLDGQETDEPSGVIRAFDAVTGTFAWAWDMGRPGQTGMPGPGQVFTRGTPNAWPPLAGDEKLGMVFVPLGNATPDYASAHRTPVMNRFNDALVALDADTGALRWDYQTTHNDVWDYDNASQPTLTDFPMPGGTTRPAVIVPTKRGVFFVLDRITGKPLVETVEKPVPGGAVPGEPLAPTQPYPVGMASFGDEKLTEARMWGISPFDQLWCRIAFRRARYDGDFTPIGLKWSIVSPGYFGGSEWGGVSVDPSRRIMVVNVNHFPMYNRMVPRNKAAAPLWRPFEPGVTQMDIKHWDQKGEAYATETGPFVSPLNTPCTQPPYGEIGAVDLTTRKTLWRKPLGTARDSGPFGIRSMLPIPMGVPTVGGSMVTQSGLTFIGSTQERSFRAFDTRTGKLLWQDRLPVSAHANPMTYWSAKSGRQFVVVSASGNPQMMTGQADYVIAYALPKR